MEPNILNYLLEEEKFSEKIFNMKLRLAPKIYDSIDLKSVIKKRQIKNFNSNNNNFI